MKMFSTLSKLAYDAAIPAALLFGAVPAVVSGDVGDIVDPGTPAPAGIDQTLWFLALAAVNLFARFGFPLLYKLAVELLRKATAAKRGGK